MNDRAAACITIRGRVQGVGFRMFAWRTAQEFGLVGTVRNEPDGSTVVVEVEGARTAIEQFYAACRHGPPRAIVEEAHLAWCVPNGRYSDFRIVG